MGALSPLFLWLLPLALLPVVIHLLNRLRYRTVKWAAMMFLRTADRDASRRARIRQWLILAARCLMLLMFLLGLARLQSRGVLSRFLNRDSGLVVILFDRSAGMEQLRGGVSSRERGLALVQEGLREARAGTRVVWIDSAAEERFPLPAGVEVSRLPVSAASQAPADFGRMLRLGLQEAARAEGGMTEMWVVTDGRASSWIPEGGVVPDWSEWAGMEGAVRLRVLDVGQVAADAGNRQLQLLGEPRREGEAVMVDLRMVRDAAEAETVPLRIETGGLSLREDVRVEGRSFQWVQRLPGGAEGEKVHAFLTLPADSNGMDHSVAVSWVPSEAKRAGIEAVSGEVVRAVRAGLLPRAGEREVVMLRGVTVPAGVQFWVREGERAVSEAEAAWLEGGGVMLVLPGPGDVEGEAVGDGEGIGVSEWNGTSGVLAADRSQMPLRLDLVRVFRAADLPEGEGVEVLARLEDGRALLTREAAGDGAVYRLAARPDREGSTLDAGFVWVPMLQRMLAEGGGEDRTRGTHRLGRWRAEGAEDWVPLDGEDLDPRLHVGRFEAGGEVVALNRPLRMDETGLIGLEEIEEWAEPFEVSVFEDRSATRRDGQARAELTSLLALLGLVFLAVESFLLTQNIRRTASVAPARTWRREAA